MTKGERIVRDIAALDDQRTLVMEQDDNMWCGWYMAEDGGVVVRQRRHISKQDAIRLRDWLTEMLQEEDQCPPTPSS